MGLQDGAYGDGIKDLLLVCFDKESLHALASTATNSKIIPDNDKEALEVILRYTESVSRFFSYKRVTSQVLFDYLHKRKVNVKSSDNKEELKNRVKSYWEENFATKDERGTSLALLRGAGDERTISRTHEPSSLYQNLPQHTPHTPSQTQTIAANLNMRTGAMETEINIRICNSSSNGGGGGNLDMHLFSHEFCKWFFSMINGLQNPGQCTGNVFSPDVFMANSSMSICLQESQGVGTVEKRDTLGPQETYDVFRNVCNNFRLIFVPNFDTGIRWEVSDHGLVKVWCCGTLQVSNAMVGVFEHEFGVIKSQEGKWKIMMMKVDLKKV